MLKVNISFGIMPLLISLADLKYHANVSMLPPEFDELVL
jgi:hypothetical protein